MAETDVRHPTDFGLLRDSLRCLIRESSLACAASGVAGWCLKDGAEALLRRVNTARRRGARPKEVKVYPAKAFDLAAKAEDSLKPLEDKGCSRRRLDKIWRLIGHARRFAGRIERRALRGEKIPGGEKAYSVFEEHARRISKGEADKPVELGVPVCIVDDGNGFVLGRRILREGGDIDAAVPLVESCMEAFPDLRGRSFDRGSAARPTVGVRTRFWR